ncbi:hypothetical protein NEMBOFW57_008895 [Staphylotrichum longicolle]|uniref:Uncharacterized protein n=1 Tax=Staphylotrichum longicolle TaxID=669026 RepID=A0AAD4ESM7_9PEZI|nr:hypothetical protein NEMBOFW57_008895 [Staphylotrichum longicolle]
MARDADSEALGANQSKRPASGFHDMGDQPQQQHPPLHHRSKSQKHIVGGTGGRLHARVPSSKGLLKHHTAASTTKLNRKHGSLSPDQGAGAALASHHHRRATSELKLTRDPSSTNLKKNPSHTILKRNRSQVEVGKRNKSSTNLNRSASNPAVNKLRSKVQFNLGDEDQDDNQDDDEWVDASTSASPLLSRRGSAHPPQRRIRPRHRDEPHQQKLNLQRASSTLEPAHPHPGLGMVPPGVVVANLNALNGPLVGVPTTYDTRDPRVGKTLERTGMQYLTVRRHLNPVARSIARVMQLPGLENSRRIPQHSHHHHPSSSSSHHPSRHHASRLSEQFVPRTSSMADLIINNNGPSTAAAAARPRSTIGNTSTNTNGAFSALQSASSSLGTAATDDDGRHGGHGGQGAAHGAQGHGPHGQGHGQGQGLSGSSLVDGAEDAGTMALLRMMWEKNPGALSASHE